jgi:prepilin-type N-terminal cleavage/methylation domain-containing protein
MPRAWAPYFARQNGSFRAILRREIRVEEARNEGKNMRARKNQQWVADRPQASDLSLQGQAADLRPQAITRNSPLPPSPFRLPPSARPRAFTLTELLIVIAIIAVLAALATAAAVNALRAANRGKITLAIQGVSRAIEDFKVDYGAYPPNAMNPGGSVSPGSYGALAVQDMQRMFNKAFPRNNEPPALIAALVGTGPTTGNQNLTEGMTAAEALYFWLGGFSEDPQYPISGPGGPSFLAASTTGEILEDRKPRYEFTLTQLGPRDQNGVFDGTDNGGKGRFITYQSPLPGESGVQRRINFWQYFPKNSTQPLVYFDVSRHKPGVGGSTYDAPAATTGLPPIYAMKQLRSGAGSVANSFANVVFVNQGKFQVLHAGLDDAWGDYFASMGCGKVSNPDDLLLYPTGPFIGEVADTLTNFSDGEIANASK